MMKTIDQGEQCEHRHTMFQNDANRKAEVIDKNARLSIFT